MAASSLHQWTKLPPSWKNKYEKKGMGNILGTEDGHGRIRKVLTAKDIFDILNFKPERMGKRQILKALSSSLFSIKDLRRLWGCSPTYSIRKAKGTYSTKRGTEARERRWSRNSPWHQLPARLLTPALETLLKKLPPGQNVSRSPAVLFPSPAVLFPVEQDSHYPITSPHTSSQYLHILCYSSFSSSLHPHSRAITYNTPNHS